MHRTGTVNTAVFYSLYPIDLFLYPQYPIDLFLYPQ